MYGPVRCTSSVCVDTCCGLCTILARGVPGTRLLVGCRFAGDKCVFWWEVVLLVGWPFAGGTQFAGKIIKLGL